MSKTLDDLYHSSDEGIAKDDELFELFIQDRIRLCSRIAVFEGSLKGVASIDKAGVWKSHQRATEIGKGLPQDCLSLDDQLGVLGTIAKMLIEYGQRDAARHIFGIVDSLQIGERDDELFKLRARFLVATKDGEKNGKRFEEAGKIFKHVAQVFYSDGNNRRKYTRRNFQKVLTSILKEKFPLMSLPSERNKTKVDSWINTAVGEELSRAISTSTKTGTKLAKVLLIKHIP